MIPHTATPAPMAVTTVFSAVTLLVKNPMIVLKTDFLHSQFFLLPIVWKMFTLLPEGIKKPCAIFSCDKMNTGSGYAIPAWGRWWCLLGRRSSSASFIQLWWLRYQVCSHESVWPYAYSVVKHRLRRHPFRMFPRSDSFSFSASWIKMLRHQTGSLHQNPTVLCIAYALLYRICLRRMVSRL